MISEDQSALDHLIRERERHMLQAALDNEVAEFSEKMKNRRMTNPIESPFATIRHRARQTKCFGSRAATLMLVFKQLKQAERHWRIKALFKLSRAPKKQYS